jgi:tellurite methyltransferase
LLYSQNLSLVRYFRNIDLYFFDHILKERFNLKMQVLDAGCGGGRNIVYFLRNGYKVFGTDENEDAIYGVKISPNR